MPKHSPIYTESEALILDASAIIDRYIPGVRPEVSGFVAGAIIRLIDTKRSAIAACENRDDTR